MELLLSAIRQIYILPNSFEVLLSQQIEGHQYYRHSLLLAPGQISSRIYFVEKGLVRGYYLKDGKDIVTGFMAEGKFVLSPASFFLQQPSFEYLELLEDSYLWSLSYNHLTDLYNTFPTFNYVGRVLTEQYYVASELRAHNLRMLTADERYLWFVTLYRPLLNRLSNRHIASFLGLTPETVSRIRAKKTGY